MPDWAPEIRARLAGVRLSPAREAEIIEELSQHLEDRWREQVASGADPEIARQQALGDFRGAEVLGRYLAPLRQSRWADPAPPAASRPFSWDGLMADLRTAVRAFRAAPGFTVIALIVLTLGIGATTAIFSVVDAVVLRPLPFDEPDRLVAVGERSTPTKGGPVPAGVGKPVPAGVGKAPPPECPGHSTPATRKLWGACSPRTIWTGRFSSRSSSHWPRLPTGNSRSRRPARHLRMWSRSV